MVARIDRDTRIFRGNYGVPASPRFVKRRPGPQCCLFGQIESDSVPVHAAFIRLFATGAAASGATP